MWWRLKAKIFPRPLDGTHSMLAANGSFSWFWQ